MMDGVSNMDYPVWKKKMDPEVYIFYSTSRWDYQKFTDRSSVDRTLVQFSKTPIFISDTFFSGTPAIHFCPGIGAKDTLMWMLKTDDGCPIATIFHILELFHSLIKLRMGIQYGHMSILKVTCFIFIFTIMDIFMYITNQVLGFSYHQNLRQKNWTGQFWAYGTLFNPF